MLRINHSLRSNLRHLRLVSHNPHRCLSSETSSGSISSSSSSRSLYTSPISSFAYFKVIAQPNNILHLVNCNLYNAPDNDILSEIRELNRNDFTIENPKITISLLYQLGKRKVDITPYDSFLIAIRQSLPMYRKTLTAETMRQLCFGLLTLPTKNNRALEILGEIACLLAVNPNTKLDSDSLGQCCNSLQYLTGRYIEERRVLVTLSKILQNNAPVDLHAFSISSAIYGVQSLNLDVAEAQELLESIAYHITTSSPKVFLDWEFGAAFYGIRNFHANKHGEGKLIAGLIKHARHSLSHPDVKLLMSNSSLASVFYGIKNLDYRRSDDARRILHMISDLMKRQKEKEDCIFSIDQFAQIVYGLQNNSASSLEEQQLIAAIVEIPVDISLKDMNVRQFSCLLYGLKSMSGSSLIEQQLLQKILRILTSAGENVRLNEQALCNVLFGIRYMQSSVPEVLQLKGFLASYIQRQEHLRLNGLQVGVCCYALSENTANMKEERELLKAIGDQVGRADRPVRSSLKRSTQLPAQALANAYYGLRNLSGYHYEERYLMQQIADFFMNYNCAPLSGQSIAGSCFSFANMKVNRYEEIQTLMMILTRHINDTPIKSLLINGSHLGSICFGLSRVTGNSLGEKAFLSAIAELIENVATKSNPPNLTALNISSIFNGIRKLNPMHPQSQRLYRAILALTSTCSSSASMDFSSKTLGSICSGLAHITGKGSGDEVAMLDYVIQIFEKNPQVKLTGTAISQAISGLKSMTGEVLIEQKLIGLIADRIDRSEYTASYMLYPMYIDYLFAGIQGLSGQSAEEKALLRHVYHLLDISKKQMISPRHVLAHSSRLITVQQELGELAAERFMLMKVLAEIIENQVFVIYREENHTVLLDCYQKLREEYPAEARLKALLKMRMSQPQQQQQAIDPQTKPIEVKLVQHEGERVIESRAASVVQEQ
jgi:hypothetical protein